MEKNTRETGKPSSSFPGAPIAATSDVNWHRRAGPVFRYGLITGFALIVLGGTALSLALTNVFLAMLVVCAGLSIILGAFGSTATVTLPGQSTTLVGVAGIAIVLMIFVVREMDDRYVRVKIGGDVQGAQVELVGDRNYLGAFQQSERSFDFIIFGKEIRRPVLALYITLEDGTERPFECIKKDVVQPYLATGKTLEWAFDEKNSELRNIEPLQRIAKLGPCREKLEARDLTEESPGRASEFSLVSTVFAQRAANSNPNDISQLIQKLESNTNYERRTARSELAAKGVDVVEPLLARFREEPLTYRSRLGVLVALTEMMRQEKQNRKEIISRIKEEDLSGLLSAVTDEDRTIRIYASEFLFDLGDPRTIPLALKQVESVSENARYNLLLVIKGAVPFVPPQQQNEVIKQIDLLKSTNTPKTNELIDSIAALTSRG